MAPRLRLREVRERLGLTRKELAERSGISVSDLQRYEDGAMSPSWSRLLRLAKVLGVSVDELLC